MTCVMPERKIFTTKLPRTRAWDERQTAQRRARGGSTAHPQILFRVYLGCQCAPAPCLQEKRKQTSQGREGKAYLPRVDLGALGVQSVKERKKTYTPKEGWEDGTPPPQKKEKEKDNPREGWEDGTPPPHRDFTPCPVSCDILNSFLFCCARKSRCKILFVCTTCVQANLAAQKTRPLWH